MFAQQRASSSLHKITRSHGWDHMARSCHQAWRQMVPASRQDSEVSLSLSLSSYTDWVPHSLDLSLGLIFSRPPLQLFISLFFISSNLFCSLTHASFYRSRRSPSNLLSALCVSAPLSLVDLLPGVNVHLGWKVHRGSWGLLLVCSGHFLILSRAVTVLVWLALPISHILICFALASC